MSLYLCVDCGGSKTSAVICDAAGEIKGRALGGPSNFAYLGIDAFIEAVKVAVSNALKTCVSPPSVDPVALPPSTPLFAAAWLGISGVDSQGAIDTLTPAVSALLGVPAGKNLIVCNDTHLLAAPLQMHPDVSCAVTCIAGTGGIVVSFTQNADGSLKEMGRVGGWGWILGDEGGGFHVGREAVRQIMLRADVASVEGHAASSDHLLLDVGAINSGLFKIETTKLPELKQELGLAGRNLPELTVEEKARIVGLAKARGILPVDEKNTLERRVMQKFGLEKDVYELLTAVHLPDPPPGIALADPALPEYARIPREKRLSQLAPLVFKSAFEDGDQLAIRVLRIASGELVDQISILCRSDAPKGIKPSEGVICFGGSLVGVENYRNLLLEQLAERGHVFKRFEFVDDAAAVGAKGLVVAIKV